MQRLRLPDSTPSGIEVWRLELHFGVSAGQADWSLLSEEERARALRYRHSEDRVRSIATRAALRRLLAARLGQMPGSLRFLANGYGKPYLQAGAGIEFNVSHAGRFALIALSRNGSVGVDIECCEPRLDVDNVIGYVFSPLERRQCTKSSDQFFRHWVAKEAVLKALGLGIGEHLQAISVLPGEGERYDVRHDHAAWPSLHAWSLDAPVGYAAALAWVDHYATRRTRHART